MSDPIAQTSSELPGVVASAVDQVVGDARGLGLTWTLRMATVVSATPLTIVYDGDTAVVTATSMLGILTNTLRVFVIQVPPSGNFVVGFAGASGIPYRALYTVTLGNPVIQLNIPGIPASLKALEIYWTARSTNASVASNLRLRVNSDTSAIYNNNFTQQNNTTLTGNVLAAATFWQVGVIAGSLAATNNYGSGHIVIPAWNQPHRTINQQHTSHFYESAANSWYETGGGLYFGVSGDYTTLNFFCDTGNIDSNSQFFVLGWP